MLRKILHFFSLSPSKVSESWFDTDEGKRTEEIGEKVYDFLEEAKANAEKRLILFKNENLSGEQIVELLAKKYELKFNESMWHFLEWLGEAALPTDPDVDYDQDVKITKLWIQDYRKKYQCPTEPGGW